MIDTQPPTLTSRRHPLAVTTYLMTLGMGLIFIFNVLGGSHQEQALFHHIPSWTVFLWEWELALGSVAAIVASSVKGRAAPYWPDLADLLRIEAIGALVSGIGLVTYMVAVVNLIGWHEFGPSGTLLGIMTAGHFARCVQAFVESNRLTRWAMLVRAVDEALHRNENES